MKTANILKLVSYLCVFVATGYGFYKIYNDNDKKAGVNVFVAGGLLPTTILGFVRHVFLQGSITNGDKFFEMEAGGANLGIATAAITALSQNADAKCLSYIILAFAVYLLVGLLAHVRHIKGKMGMKIAFLVFIATLGYFVYEGQTA
jgi:hypothetical protein